MSCHGPSQCGRIRSAGRIRQLPINVEESSCWKCGCGIARSRKECLQENGAICHTGCDRDNDKLADVSIRSIQDSEHIEFGLDQRYQPWTQLLFCYGLLPFVQESGHNLVGRSERVRQDTMDSHIPASRLHDDLSHPFRYGLCEAKMADVYLYGSLLLQMEER